MSGGGKLVRDNIPDVVLTSGRKPICRIASDDAEYTSLLRRKLVEEVGEFLEAAPEDRAEELADVIEVAFALAHMLGMDAVTRRREQKADRLGAFFRRLVWEGNFEAPSRLPGE